MLSSEGLYQYLLPLDEIGESTPLQLRRIKFGCAAKYSHEKTVLVVGETGVGKTTLIDAFVNHNLGVTTADNMRFHVVDQQFVPVTTSQTDWITCYTIYPTARSNVPFTINLVDTPGFGDTRGLSKDQQIINHIKTIFEAKDSQGLISVNAVCFVIKATENRENAKLRYIMDSVLGLFGKDLVKHICVVYTFFDGSKNNAIHCVENIPHSNYFQFNNSWLMPSEFSEIPKDFFRIGQVSFIKFVDFLKTTSAKSLQMTVQVLKERENLQEDVERIQDFISKLSGEVVNLTQIDKLLAENPQQTVVLHILKPSKHLTSTKNMNCEDCQYTCRKDINKFNQFVTKIFLAKTKCRICSCPIKKHKFESYSITCTNISETITMAELKKRYSENPRGGVEKEKSELVSKIIQALLRMKSGIHRLNQIALKPCLMSSNDYIDLVIRREEMNLNPESKKRIGIMKMLKQQNELVVDMRDDNEYI